MTTTTRTRGDPARARDRPRRRGPAEAAGRDRRPRRSLAGRGPRAARVLRPRRQGPRRARALRRRRAVGGRAMTIDELRAFCLALPEHPRAGDLGRRRARRRRHVPRPRARSTSSPDRTAVARASAPTESSRPTCSPRSPMPSRARAYVGRFGWVTVRLDALDPCHHPRHHRLGLATDGPEGRRGRRTTRPPARPGRRPDERGGRTDVDRHGGGERHERRPPAPPGSPPRSRARAADGRAALIPYVVAGYPDAETSLAVALAAADAGADLLEVGLPYSDPLADGATLQRASGVALRAGATLERSLRLIERIGAARPDLPLVPMGYANQVIGGGDGEAVAAPARGRRARPGSSWPT